MSPDDITAGWEAWTAAFLAVEPVEPDAADGFCAHTAATRFCACDGAAADDWFGRER